MLTSRWGWSRGNRSSRRCRSRGRHGCAAYGNECESQNGPSHQGPPLCRGGGLGEVADGASQGGSGSWDEPLVRSPLGRQAEDREGTAKAAQGIAARRVRAAAIPRPALRSAGCVARRTARCMAVTDSERASHTRPNDPGYAWSQVPRTRVRMRPPPMPTPSTALTRCHLPTTVNAMRILASKLPTVRGIPAEVMPVPLASPSA